MDNRSHIPSEQTHTGEIVRQHYAVVFFDHDSSEGYAVMSRGAVARALEVSPYSPAFAIASRRVTSRCFAAEMS